MGVNHGGFDIFVAEEFLDGANFVAVLEEMGGKAMSKGMTANLFRNVGLASGLFDRSL